MSVIPFTTQLPNASKTGLLSQTSVRFVLVYNEKITERQAKLMQECQEYICQYINMLTVCEHDLSALDSTQRYFVIPLPKDDIIAKIRSRFKDSIIYLPRAIIEARSHFMVNLPARSLVISLTMHNCRIFPVRNCDQTSLKRKINEMSGHIAPSFTDSEPNVLLTDRGDNSYCSKAHKRNIPVVSRNWIDENYNTAHDDDKSFFCRDALDSIQEHQIKPFFGLYFKLNIKNSAFQVKKLITENEGHIIYGNENSLTHVVQPVGDYSEPLPENREQPKLVDVDFLSSCATSGYYLTRREYREILERKQVRVKQEKPSAQPVDMQVEETSAQTISNEPALPDENHTMPPPSVQRPQKQQTDGLNDMILKALSTFETPQTQLASTQVRRLPDSELRIEQSFEPSQHLFWSDSVTRKK